MSGFQVLRGLAGAGEFRLEADLLKKIQYSDLLEPVCDQGFSQTGNAVPDGSERAVEFSPTGSVAARFEEAGFHVLETGDFVEHLQLVASELPVVAHRVERMLLVENGSGVDVVALVVVGDVLAAQQSGAIPKTGHVRHIDFADAARFEDAQEFPHGRQRGVGDMLHDLAAGNRVEGLILPWVCVHLDVADLIVNVGLFVERAQAVVRFAQIQGVAFVPETAEGLDEDAAAGADVDDAFAPLKRGDDFCESIYRTQEVVQ